MEFKFVSNKPWVDETLRLRKALFFTTLTMVILGLILAIIGIVLLAYMEFVVGVIAIIFGVLIPVGYVGANVLLFARRRKSYDKNMVVEYRFTEDALEIVRLSDHFKAKNVVDYSSFSVNKVYNKSRYVVLKTKNYYSDIIVIRKKDIVLEEGQLQNQAIVSFVSFLMAKVAEATRAQEITCEEGENSANNEISGQNDENIAPIEAENVESSAPINVEECAEEDIDTSSVEFDDLTESDEVNDIIDEPGEDAEPEVYKYDVVEEDVELDSEDGVDEPIVENESEDEVVEDAEDESDSLFDYGKTYVSNDDLVSEPKEDNNYFHDYTSVEEDDQQ